MSAVPGRLRAAPARTARRLALPAAWRESAREAGLAFGASRLLAWAAALGSLGLFGARGPAAPAGVPEWFAALAVRWDALHFGAVARHGYPASGGEEWAFFPGFPALMSLGGGGAGAYVLGALVASGCAWAGLAVVHRLAVETVGPAAARRAVWLLALFPASLFLSAAYSEGPFLLLTAGAVLAARHERWALAGLAGAVAVLTRNTGIVVLVPLLLLVWRVRPPRPAAAWLALPVLALGGWLAWAAARTGDGLASWHAQATWGRGFHGPGSAIPAGVADAWEALPRLLAATPPGDFEPPWMKLLLLACLVWALVAAAGAWRRLGAPLGLYAALALAVPLSAPWWEHPLMSLPRFVLVLFPLFLWAGTRPRAFKPTLAIFALGLVVLAGRFGAGAWAA